MVGIECIAATGIIDVLARIVLQQAVVAGIVDAPEAQRRPGTITLRGVVVNHVENDLDAGLVQFSHHGLELIALAAAEVARRWCKETQRVVTPVVDQVFLHQEFIVDEFVNRQ